MDSVLIVEPDENIARQIKMLAAQSGFEIIDWVEDEKKAMDKACNSADSCFDLIISEWQLTQTNALAFFEELKTKIPDKKIYFIIISANASVTQVKLAAHAGVYAYVLKPIDPTIMITRISTLRNKVKKSC
jgi:DNA-binding response OmpR family regulator